MSGRPYRSVPLGLVVIAAASLAACGGGEGEAADGAVPADPDAVVVAEDMGFDVDELRVAAGRPVSIVIDNRDDGVNHNIHIEDAPEPNATRLVQGPSQQALTVTLEEGSYDFVCDIHPNMNGEVIAE
jgi:plastocyanin